MSSDISDVDEDEELQPQKRGNSRHLQMLASKGWNTCSVGFDGTCDRINSPSQIYPKQIKVKSLATDNRHNRKVNALQSKQKQVSRNAKVHLTAKAPIRKTVLSNLSNQSINHNSQNCNDEIEIYSSSPEVNTCDTKNSTNEVQKSKNWTFKDFSTTFAEGHAGQQCPVSSRRRKADNNATALMHLNRKRLSTINEDCNWERANCESSASPVISTDSTNSSNEKSHSACEENSRNEVPIIEDNENIAKNKGNAEIRKKSNYLCTGKEWLQSISKNKDSSFKRVDQCEEKPHRPCKFVPGGLAEQASKIENRERTSRIIWSHKKMENSVKWLHKCLVLLVQSNCDIDGFLAWRCVIVKRPVPSPPSSFTSIDSSPAASSEPIRGNPVSSVPSQAAEVSNLSSGENALENCLLLLRPGSPNTTGVACGDKIYVYPPWHSLKIPLDPFQAILCTYFTCTSNVPPVKEVSKNFIEELVYCKTDQVPNFLQQLLHFPEYSTEIERHLLSSNFSAKIPSLKATDKSLDQPRQPPLKAEEEMETVAAGDLNSSGDIAQQYFLQSAFPSRSPTVRICARIQRIWWYKASEDKNVPSCSNLNNNCVSLLLQDKNSRFCELQINSFQDISKHNIWYSVIHSGEGKCYRFEGIQVSQKMLYSKHLYLFSLLNAINNEQQKGMADVSPLQPEFYKMVACCRQSSVFSVAENLFPSYSSCEISTLKMLFKGHKCFKRFSCVVKVICEVDGTFYLTDATLRNVASQYVKLLFHTCGLKPDVKPGSVIFLKEAAVPKGLLLVDRCTTIKVLAPASLKAMSSFRRLPFAKQVFAVMKSLLFLDVKCLDWHPISANSRVGELVSVEGQIVDVERETAVSWLQCGACSEEDLYEDSNSRIYCKTCDRVISNTVLRMKMSVLVRTANLQAASVHVELSCATTKKLLQVPDEEKQPKCNITDVLNKSLWPLICYVKSRRCTNQQIIFRLCEVALH